MDVRHRHSLPMTTVIVFIGLISFISGCSSRSTPAPVEELYTGKTYKDYEANSLTDKTYQVEAGETLYSIAFRANQDVNQLAKLNNLSKPYVIYPGQRLKLKGDVAQPRPTSPVAETKPNNNTSSSSQKDIKQPVAKTQQKEYGQKVDKKKTVAKQTTKAKSETPKKREKRVITAAPRSRQENVKNRDIQWRWPSTGQVIKDFSVAERGNKGLDFAGQRGDPVIAAAAGKVVYVGDALRGFGRLIILKHNDDFITAYAHNDKILVKEQDWVDVGETIGEMGDSGSQRVKLHFEVRYRGKSVNPRHYLPKSR
ncbi:peptidase M23 [Idiomarina seosinensis]|uniref:Peptidase M23 n=2 Tax=Idiomarina seosinensis TaxID=281739 RepID=A0A432ZHI1_9GAMM|nr:peptidase M23 [Idiomarina seosinensis]